MSNPRIKQAIALTVAGSDSGGGAGIQADLKTFAALAVHGTCAITCVTAQNPRRVTAIHALPPTLVRRQLEAVIDELPPNAMKTGMLYTPEIIRVVAKFARHNSHIPLVVDPVMVATSGSRLIRRKALTSARDELLPLAQLVTPNVPESMQLADMAIKDPEDLREAARRIHSIFGCAVLVKGGHLHSMKEAVDIFYDGKTEVMLSAPFRRGIRTHGTGCTYAAAIAAYLARGLNLIRAVQMAKDYITQAIDGCRQVGKHTVLGHI
jgi:hydroxymethylpyrimidine/phosphomethylpyrimidine kinase